MTSLLINLITYALSLWLTILTWYFHAFVNTVLIFSCNCIYCRTYVITSLTDFFRHFINRPLLSSIHWCCCRIQSRSTNCAFSSLISYVANSRSIFVIIILYHPFHSCYVYTKLWLINILEFLSSWERERERESERERERELQSFGFRALAAWRFRDVV